MYDKEIVNNYFERERERESDDWLCLNTTLVLLVMYDWASIHKENRTNGDCTVCARLNALGDQAEIL